jgi:predicted TIM-barrel fold metal-dependent hydrolase
MPQDFPEDPLVAMRRAVHISPFWEDDYDKLAELLGPERVLFGSDYPHPEGLENPAKFSDEIARFGEDRVRMYMGGNLARLMNMENVALAPTKV